MHPDRMRALDRRLGRPLCRAASAVLRLGRRARAGRQDREEPPRAVLFIGLAELGALVLAWPALTHAQRRFPEARTLFLTFPAGVAMLQMMGFGRDAIIVVDPRSLWTLAASTLAAVRRLRRERPLFAVTLEVYSRFATLLAASSGARRRAGFHPFREEGGDIGGLLTHRVVYTPHHHIAASYVGLVEALGEPGGFEPCNKRRPPDVRRDRLVLARDEALCAAVAARVRDSLPESVRVPEPEDGIVILNGNASDLVPLRRWPEANYVALAQRLLDAFPIVVVLTGTDAEAPYTASMARRIGRPRVVDFAGRTTLAELIALYHVARLLVTNDSGPAHFASTTNLPSVVLYGPETPRIFGPLGPHQEAVSLGLLCSPCVSVYNQKSSACTDNVCMRAISVDDVFRHCARVLGDRRP